MAIIEFNLLAETESSGRSYSVTVDEAIEGLVRLVVSCSSKNGKETELYQGVDLTAQECEALGKHLVAISERLNKY